MISWKGHVETQNAYAVCKGEPDLPSELDGSQWYVWISKRQTFSIDNNISVKLGGIRTPMDSLDSNSPSEEFQQGALFASMKDLTINDIWVFNKTKKNNPITSAEIPTTPKERRPNTSNLRRASVEIRLDAGLDFANHNEEAVWSTEYL